VSSRDVLVLVLVLDRDVLSCPCPYSSS
jgi:hypothetical protein